MSGHHRFDTLRARLTPARLAQNAVKAQALRADRGEDVQVAARCGSALPRGFLALRADRGEDVQAPEP